MSGKNKSGNKAADIVRQFDLELGSVGINEDTASIGCRIAREGVELSEIDSWLTNRRIVGNLAAVRKTEAQEEGQAEMFETMTTIHGAFEVKRISVGTEDVTFRVQFSKSDIDVSELSKMTGKDGRLNIRDVTETTEE